MKILITGAAGFIGYNFCNYLLSKNNYKVYGIDNFDNYYDVKIKKDRVIKMIEIKNESLVLIFFVSIQDALA